ncbi:MAG TPA: radical SAM protein [Syntrophales bacterium]|nr:radical SAM protein [Syntrophales bacterium]
MIIPFFIMNQGCPNRCIFCNVHKTAGNHTGRITEDTFRETVYEYLSHKKQNRDHVQIAFYGGNFTGMEKDYQAELLGFAGPFIKQGMVYDLRISTRPDNIDDDSLNLLKRFRVTTVEIGVQSLVDEVLSLSNRGHSSSDVMTATELLKDWGFKTGIHLMVGLPGDSRSGFEYTISKTIVLKPDMVRIHPTVVFQDTALAEMYESGDYTPLSMSEAIDMCKYALRRFEEADIPIIRLGLQTTREMEKAGSIIAGPYHPAFRSLVEESIFLDMASSLLTAGGVLAKEVIFTVSPKDISSFHGHKNENIHALKKRYNLTGINVSVDHGQERRTLAMTVSGRKTKTNRLGGVVEKPFFRGLFKNA